MHPPSDDDDEEGCISEEEGEDRSSAINVINSPLQMPVVQQEQAAVGIVPAHRLLTVEDSAATATGGGGAVPMSEKAHQALSLSSINETSSLPYETGMAMMVEIPGKVVHQRRQNQQQNSNTGRSHTTQRRSACQRLICENVTGASDTGSDGEAEVPSTDVISLNRGKGSFPSTSSYKEDISPDLCGGRGGRLEASSAKDFVANPPLTSRNGGTTRQSTFSMPSSLFGHEQQQSGSWAPPQVQPFQLPGSSGTASSSVLNFGAQPFMVYVPTLQRDGSVTLVPTWTTPSSTQRTSVLETPPVLSFRHHQSSSPPCSKDRHISNTLLSGRVPPPPPPPLIDPYAPTSSTAALNILPYTDNRPPLLLSKVTSSQTSSTPMQQHPFFGYRLDYSSGGGQQQFVSDRGFKSVQHNPNWMAHNAQTKNNGLSWNPETDCKQDEEPPRVPPNKPPPPPPPDEQSRSHRRNEFYCASCDREFRGRAAYDLHVTEDHVPCEHEDCAWKGPPSLLLAHNLSHIRGQDGEVVCTSKTEEVAWLASRKKRRELKQSGADPRKDKTPMSQLELALRESLKVRKTKKVRLSANLLRRQVKDAGVLPQAHAYVRMFDAKRTETFEGPELGRADQCRIWQEFNICEAFLRHRTCRFGNTCNRSHDIKRYQEWCINRIKSGIKVKMRHYNAKALLYRLAAPEIIRYERTLLKCFQVLHKNNFWLSSKFHSLSSPKDASSLNENDREKTILL